MLKDVAQTDQPLPGYEQSLLYLAGAVALVIGWAGGWSLTRMFVPRLPE